MPLILSRIPKLTSPDGVNTKPKYLYSLTVLIGHSLILKFLQINLPVLLKIIHFGFSLLILNFDSMLFSPSFSDNNTRSSVHKVQLSFSPPAIGGAQLLGKS